MEILSVTIVESDWMDWGDQVPCAWIIRNCTGDNNRYCNCIVDDSS